MTLFGDLQMWCQSLYERHLQERINRTWTHLEPHLSTIKTVFLHGFVVFVIASTCLYISAFLFGALYYYNMPTIYHSFDLKFRYNRQCIEQHRNYLRNGQGGASFYKKECYPTALVDLGSPAGIESLKKDQLYRMSLRLLLPETHSNLGIGMFMVSMRCGKLYSSQATSMRHKSQLIRYASTILFWPLLLFDFMDEVQTLDVVLFEEARLGDVDKSETQLCARQYPKHIYNINCDHWISVIDIDYPDIQIYSAQLQVTATFSGLQYLLFQWPVFSFLVGTAIFFVPVLSLMLVFLYLILFKPYQSMRSPITGDINGRARRRRAIQAERLEEEIELELIHDEEDTATSPSSAPALSSSVEVVGSDPENASTGSPEPQISPEEASSSSSVRRRTNLPTNDT